MTYCTDADLFIWEPTLAFDSQAAATPVVDCQIELRDGRLISRSVDLDRAGVRAGDHVVIDRIAIGIAARVDSHAFELHRPAVREIDSTRASIRTFRSQRKAVSRLLENLLNLGGDDARRICKPVELRRACATGTLLLISSILSMACGEQSSGLAVRSQLHGRLFRKFVRSLRVSVDIDGDGEPDAKRGVDVAALVRVA